MIPDQLLSTISQKQSFLVASHSSPDGDAIGSSLALGLALKGMGKDVVIYNQDGVPKDYTFLPGSSLVVSQLDQGQQFDVGFVLDAGELRRAGEWIRSRCDCLVNVDHHPYSENFGEIFFVDVQASATGVLVWRILDQINWPITLDVATCIYTAILSDTGSFRYSNANREAFSVAGEMVALGVDPWSIASGLYESQDAARLRLLALSLPTLKISDSGAYASVAVTLEMYKQTGSNAEHTDRFVNYPRSVSGVEVAIFFRQLDSDTFKVGFRSKGKIDVGSLAREMGGGGHHNAAGATAKGSLKDVEQWVFRRLDDLLENL
ncbi:MAG: DHH family phosphoesterase [Deltaproteobacteria bacterium]|jgi:phosphoesterase RecJ-like protein|nr:DHH family phosphoesterase [Deltaproteobacteria bacterium]